MYTEAVYSKIFNQWLPAVRDSFVVALPLTMMIAFIAVFRDLPSDAYSVVMDETFGPSWRTFALRIYEGTAGMMALAIAATTAVRLNGSKSTRSRDQSVALITVAAYAASVAPIVSDVPSSFGFTQILLGAFVGVATVEVLKIYLQLLDKGDRVNRISSSLLLQDGMRLVFPGLLTVITVMLLAGIAREFSAFSVNLLNTGMAKMAAHQLDEGWMTAFSLVMSQMFWMLGVHGDDMLIALIPNLLAPDNALQASGKISISVLNTFVHLGGSGATAGLILALLWRSKDGGLRRIAFASLLPMVMNVNEIIIYGLPIVFSPLMLVPFVATPLICYCITVSAQSIGFLTLSGTAVSWSTPLFVSGYLVSGGWQGVAIQCLNIIVSSAVYWPFLKVLMHRRQLRQREDIRNALSLVSAGNIQTERFTLRNDNVGELCRAIVSDFERDLNSSQVTIHYQGKHDRKGRVCGAETLLRWNHAVHGYISPLAIVRLSEESDVINRLGAVALTKSCEALARWKKEGIGDLKLSINVSPIQLESPTYVDRVMRTLQQSGLSVHDIELEITEGQALPNSEDADANLRRLTELGISLSIDDFGMGCTSLMYLQRFRVASIKLDGALTRDVLNSAVSADIVKTICQLGHDRGARVVAEFVESEEQKERLASMGCHEFQGYLFSKPMPEAEFVTMLRRQAVIQEDTNQLACRSIPREFKNI